MIKVKIRVKCYGWTAGYYENTIYFESADQARKWAENKPHVTIISIEEVEQDNRTK